MKQSILSILILIVFGTFSISRADEWKIDKAHTNIGFTISHLVISDVTGWFSEFDGTFSSNTDDFSGSEVRFVIKTASISTANEKRDNHLRSSDFFNAETNPDITFESTAFNKLDDKNYEVSGKLTMNGITKDVILNTIFRGLIKDPWGGTRAAFKAATSLDRDDYNLTYNKALESGGYLIGKTVDIEINLQLIKK